VHFGKFAAHYIQQNYFMDVHPPLAKLLITLVAWLHGFKGDFEFESIGDEYLTTPDTEPVPYVAMRGLSAWLGTLTVPVAYVTLRALALSPITSILASVLLIFENALTTQSRLILLDATLIFFVSTSLCSWAFFMRAEQRSPFSREWWTWLLLTGVSLGLVLSSKWVGLFTVASIGLPVVVQLWYHLGDRRVSIPTLAHHVFARAVCLIFVPLIVYTLIFAVHFNVLTKSGTGDNFMSWAFRHTLDGNGMPDTYRDVLLGSTVRLQHKNTLGGYLHSHKHDYETGSRQQQITLYPFFDENNEWIVIRAPQGEEEYQQDEEGFAITPPDEITRFYQNVTALKDGDLVRFIHKQTMVRLHSHADHRPPVSENDYQNEVSGYGFPDTNFGGDWNDNWVVEIHEQPNTVRSADRKNIQSLRTVFRLRHANLGCYLFSHKVALPSWGYGQQEVVCNNEPTLPNSLWYIETNDHPLLNEESVSVNYQVPTFWQKLKELHGVMWETNNELTEHHVYESRPWTWPILRRGINFWVKEHRQLYLFGNPLTWWTATACVMLYLAVRVLLILRAQRGFQDFTNTTVAQYDRVCGLLFVAWALHYLPFFLMKRQLFLHHYLPALYISILLAAAVFDCVTHRLHPRLRLYAAAVISIAAVLVFLRYSPLVYASRWTGDQCQSSILWRPWDFNCVDFPDNLSEYQTYGSVVNRPGVAGADDAPFFPKIQELINRKVKSGRRVMQTTEGQTYNVNETHVPNMSGFGQAQRQQMVLEGTGAMSQESSAKSTSSVAPKGASSAAAAAA